MDHEAQKRLIKIMLRELPAIRAKLDISQLELAERIGVTRQTLSAIETGKREMSWVLFMAMLAFFENNKGSLSQLALIGLFDDKDFQTCISVNHKGEK